MNTVHEGRKADDRQWHKDEQAQGSQGPVGAAIRNFTAARKQEDKDAAAEKKREQRESAAAQKRKKEKQDKEDRAAEVLRKKEEATASREAERKARQEEVRAAVALALLRLRCVRLACSCVNHFAWSPLGR